MAGVDSAGSNKGEQADADAVGGGKGQSSGAPYSVLSGADFEDALQELCDLRHHRKRVAEEEEEEITHALKWTTRCPVGCRRRCW